MQDYRRLKVWQAAHALTLRLYGVTERFPATERYGLTAQLRRSIASVASNIAEGSMRSTDGGFANYLDIASASASETDYSLLLAHELGYLDLQTYGEVNAELRSLRRQLAALTRVVRGVGRWRHRPANSQQPIADSAADAGSAGIS